MIIEKRLEELGIKLEESVAPIANYVAVQQAGDLLFLSGAGPVRGGRATMTGRLGEDLSMEDARKAAREGAFNLTCALKSYLGDLDRVIQIVKLTGYVNCTPDFTAQPKVIDGASDFFVEVFGDRGRHARVAVGVSSLPLDTPVEVEIVVHIKQEA
ncbi:MAG: RidA family protein [Firmicutes bacterium]|nr:RidA family protein [Bacillota bacterium]